MKKLITLSAIFFSFISCAQTHPSDPLNTKFPITADMTFQNNIALERIAKLFDGNIHDRYNPGYPGQLHNTERHTITILFPKEWNAIPKKIRIHAGDYGSDYQGVATKYYLQRRDNKQLVEVASVSSLPYQKWVEFNVSDKITPFVTDKMVIIGGGTGKGETTLYGSEMEIYGAYAASKSKTATSNPERPKAPLKNMLGSNGFWWDITQDPKNTSASQSTAFAPKVNQYRDMGLTSYRLYIDWANLEPAEKRIAFNPTRQGWDTKAALKSLKDIGAEPLFTLQGMPAHMFNTWPEKQGAQFWTNVRYEDRDNRDKATSYYDLARIGFIIAGTYGRNKRIADSVMGKPFSQKEADSKQWYIKDNVIEHGLDLLRYIEIGNEMDKNWQGTYAFHDGYKHGAMLSAAYDGHKKTIDVGHGPGVGVGIKNADSTMQVVMGGFAFPNTEFLKGIVEWSKDNRGYKKDGSVDLPFDIINYHHYSTDAGLAGQFAPTTTAMPSELSGVLKALDEFIMFSNQHGNQKPVWISEWGTDYDSLSQFGVYSFSGYSREEIIGAWAVRNMLTMLEHGADRLQWYRTFDENPAGHHFFNTMSLMDYDLKRRTVAEYFAQLKYFGEYKYSRTINKSPYVIELKKGDAILYAIWQVEDTFSTNKPKYITSDFAVKTVKTTGFKERTGTYNLSLPNNPHIRVHTFQNGVLTMKNTHVEVKGGKYGVKYGMKPVMVEVLKK